MIIVRVASVVLAMVLLVLVRVLAYSDHLVLAHIRLVGLLIFDEVVLVLALIRYVLRTGVLVGILGALLGRPDAIAHPLSADRVIAEPAICNLRFLLLWLLLLVILGHLLNLRWLLLVASSWVEVVAGRLSDHHFLAASDLRRLRRASLLTFLHLVPLLILIMVALILPQGNIQLHIVHVAVAVVEHFLRVGAFAYLLLVHDKVGGLRGRRRRLLQLD